MRTRTLLLCVLLAPLLLPAAAQAYYTVEGQPVHYNDVDGGQGGVESDTTVSSVRKNGNAVVTLVERKAPTVQALGQTCEQRDGAAALTFDCISNLASDLAADLGGGNDRWFAPQVELNQDITGGPGVDQITTGPGEDVIRVREKTRVNAKVQVKADADALIDCGPGDDTAFVDAEDVPKVRNCETISTPDRTIQNPQKGSPPPAKPKASPPGNAPTTGQPRFPAKIVVQRAGVSKGKLDVLARITGRATGSVGVSYVSSGKTTNFNASIKNGTVRISKKLPSSQARKSTGIVTLFYYGNDRVRPDTVRLRAASGKANLRRKTATIDSHGRLRASGSISSRARGVVRIRLGYIESGGTVTFLKYQARISKGRWSLTQNLPDRAAQTGGQLSIQFTGYEARKIRGEQDAKQVKP